MKHWQHNNNIEQQQILDIVSSKTGLPRLAVEKDWWVTMVLKALSVTQYAHLMSFKGRTSLSKGWQLIERFSEDIDIALKREVNPATPEKWSVNQFSGVEPCRIAINYFAAQKEFI